MPYDNILLTIGSTPVVRINKLGPAHVQLFAKIEAFNPMGSLKDRIALAIIEDAERTGKLKPGQTVIEASSGNTGIALAMVCAQKGYPLVVVMAENFSVERRRLMRFLGAKVVLTPAAEKGSGMLRKAKELAQRKGWFFCDQFENQANAEAHYRTTAAEILAEFNGIGLDYVVLGAGTGGTVNGIARAILRARPETRIVVCEPANSSLLRHHIDNGLERQPAGVSNAAFRPHPIQGWSPDFVPPFAAMTAELGQIHSVVPVEGDAALDSARELARKEGIFCGVSGGATLAGALKICEQAEPGTTVLFLVPDTGERYLSTPLFADIPADMTAEELALAGPVSEPPQVETEAVGLARPVPMQDSQRSQEFVAAVLSDRDAPVVMFALQWCEFSWAIRRFLAARGISCNIIELDSPMLPAEVDAAAVRAALRTRTGVPTIPQLFVGGHHIGGATDAFAAWRAGALQRRLEEIGVAYQSSEEDPAVFMPAWVMRRHG